MDATMHEDPTRPAITLGDAEHRRLLFLAMTEPGHSAEDSDFLNYELDRATLLPDGKVPMDVARVGSTVTYRSGHEDRPRVVTIVEPAQVGPGNGKVSVLSPLGAALLGLRAGQAITRMSYDGNYCTFTVIAVRPSRSLQ
jgi:regulator of nucleoside diphosphate kinase